MIDALYVPSRSQARLSIESYLPNLGYSGTITPVPCCQSRPARKKLN